MELKDMSNEELVHSFGTMAKYGDVDKWDETVSELLSRLEQGDEAIRNKISEREERYVMITNDTGEKQGTCYATTETISKAIKMFAGEEILILTKEIAKESADITERFFVKFEKIMESRPPAKELNADTNFPPYFQELAIGLREIRKNIDRIQEGIQRAEI